MSIALNHDTTLFLSMKLRTPKISELTWFLGYNFNMGKHQSQKGYLKTDVGNY